MKNGSTTIILNAWRHGWCQVNQVHQRQNIHASKIMLCIWWDQRSIIYYELFKPSETITGDRYRLQLICLNQALKEKRPEWHNRHNKLIMLHDNARPHVAKPVKKYLKGVKWEILPHPPFTEHYFFRFPFVPIHAVGPFWRTIQFLWRYQKIAWWMDRFKEPDFFIRGISLLSERWEKVVASEGAYFE